MTYIVNSIGENYMEWKEKDVVFISAPTGSGKTTFILETLLPYLADKNQNILYFVNRSILKKQLEDEISNLSSELATRISIEMYQTLEGKLVDCTGEWFWQGYDRLYQDYDCVVCDEAHYFLMDSNYNTNTILSYKYIMNNLRSKLRIYIKISKVNSTVRLCGGINSCISRV